MSKSNKAKATYALVVGAIYVLFGTIQFLASLGVSIVPEWVVEDNIFGSLVMVLLGVVFLFGRAKLERDPEEGTAFIFTGIFISLLYAFLDLLVLGADILNALLEGTAVDVLGGIGPLIYLGFLPLLGYYIWRDGFSFRGLSKAGA